MCRENGERGGVGVGVVGGSALSRHDRRIGGVMGVIGARESGVGFGRVCDTSYA